MEFSQQFQYAKSRIIIVTNWAGICNETASVMLQVASYKLTKKRIFKMSPIHHHFELSGWGEWKVVTVFWTAGLISGLIGLWIGVH